MAREWGLRERKDSDVGWLLGSRVSGGWLAGREAGPSFPGVCVPRVTRAQGSEGMEGKEAQRSLGRCSKAQRPGKARAGVFPFPGGLVCPCCAVGTALPHPLLSPLH